MQRWKDNPTDVPKNRPRGLGHDDEDEQDESSKAGLSSTNREFWIAGAIARQAEQRGLIHPADEFSWEWHELFEVDCATAQAGDAGEISQEGTAQASESPASGSQQGNPNAASDLGSGFGSDFGSGFGGSHGSF